MSTRQERIEALLQERGEQDELWREVTRAVARMPREELPVPGEVLAQLDSLAAAPAPLAPALPVTGIRA